MPKQSDALKVVVHYKPDTARMVQAILAVLLWPCPRPVEDESRLNEEGRSKAKTDKSRQAPKRAAASTHRHLRQSEQAKQNCREANSRECRSNRCERIAFPALGGLPAFLLVRRSGIGVLRRLVSFRGFNQRDDGKMLQDKKRESRDRPGDKHCKHQFAKPAHGRTQWQGNPEACRVSWAALCAPGRDEKPTA